MLTLERPTSPQLETPDYSKVVVATTTFNPKWYPGELNWKMGQEVTPDVVHKVRGDLSIETTTIAAEKSVNVVVVDGGDESHPFRQALSRPFVQVYNETDRGMSPSRQQAFRLALTMEQSEAFLWVEPEKRSMTKDSLEPMMDPLLSGEADVTIPERDAASFASYPDYQVDEEQESNYCWNQMLKEQGILQYEHPGYDVWHGPKGFHRRASGLFLRKYKSTSPEDKLVTPQLYGNAIFIPVIAALAEGYRVKSVPVSYQHPEIQTKIEADSDEFRAKRKFQQDSILETSKEYLAFIRGEKSKLAIDN